jgi:dolichol-phosphate mannosyltransferase
MKVSIVTAAHNEEKNVIPLYRQIKKAMEGRDYEVVIVDDGSTDHTYDWLMEIRDPDLCVIRFEKRTGQSYALHEGMKKAAGDVIATLDSDLQNDPSDIPRMVAELDRGYDCVCGWRRDRKDSPVKRMFSRMGNSFVNKILGMKLHDSNCPIRVFRKECVSGIRYFSNFHRFLPFMISRQGFRIKECVVGHRPRVHGSSKYGIHDRIFGNLMTAFLVKFRYRDMIKCNQTSG